LITSCAADCLPQQLDLKENRFSFPLLHTFLMISPRNTSVKETALFAIQRVGAINCGPPHLIAVHYIHSANSISIIILMPLAGSISADIRGD